MIVVLLLMLAEFVQAAPEGLTPRQRFEWKKREHFERVEAQRREHREHIKKITKIDYSTFKPQSFGEMEQYCLSDYEPTALTTKGQRVKMLGAAFVNMDKSQGPSAWGHVAERFVYCVDRELRDDLFEYLPLKNELLQVLAEDLKRRYDLDIYSYPEEYLSSIQGAHAVTFAVRPFDGRYKQIQVDENRAIFEAWFNTSEEKMYEMLRNNARRFSDQVKALREQRSLAKYNLLSNNCTTPIIEDIKIINPAFLAKFRGPVLTPSFLYNRVKKLPIDRIIVYPSQRMFRILQMKENGESTYLENFAPFSKASKGARRSGWVFFYADSQSRWKKILLMPVGGVVNSVSAVLETTFGLVMVPKRGFSKVKAGFSNLVWSIAEIAYLRMRYPSPTPWTEDEIKFIEGFEQTTALLQLLEAQYLRTPIEIQTLIN